jgi:hypothetical protein
VSYPSEVYSDGEDIHEHEGLRVSPAKRSMKKMKSEERKRMMLFIDKSTFEYPKGLEQYMPVDEKAISFFKYEDPSIDSNLEKYFKEQTSIKNQVKELYDELEKLFAEYQKNASKLLEYLKGLNL